jgi:RNAse (barnase) inhibitor barstar
MQTLELDGRRWKAEKDFYDALAAALGSFDRHGRNADAFEETMIYYLDLNTVRPPYEIVVRNAPEDLLPFLRKFARWIAEARQDRRNDPDWGDDVEVVVTVA